MRISDWSSDVFSSDLACYREGKDVQRLLPQLATYLGHVDIKSTQRYLHMTPELLEEAGRRFAQYAQCGGQSRMTAICLASGSRSEEHTSELQSLMRISYAVFCLKKKTKQLTTQ